jgi:hypothetical protein
MKQPNSPRGPSRETAQWQFLSALCAANLPVALRTEFCRKTRPEAFDDIACRTVFEEIVAMTKLEKPQSVQALRDELPARVTRRGFPELDFDLLFSGEVSHEGGTDQFGEGGFGVDLNAANSAADKAISRLLMAVDNLTNSNC